MNLHKEIHFETEICESLATRGWLYAEGDAAHYSAPLALFQPDVFAWIEATQPDAWKALVKQHGKKTHDIVLARLRQQLDELGTLGVLRRGIELLGLKHYLKLAEFKPALALNAEILGRYAANRLRVVRQVRYSTANDNAIDLVLFLNGVPVATLELKSDFTQSVQDAIAQYRHDRHPHPKGKSREPLLTFVSGALVHFAVSQSEVHLTTRLAGPATAFLPFNQGCDGGAGNPLHANGPATAYLWEQVLARDSWLDILGRYVVAKRNKNRPTEIERIIVPRYHQLEVTRKLLEAVEREGPGGRYLVQHSAGSGKTNSIAWTAHFLADLHDAENRKTFDTVLVVSDRQVIDDQLREAVADVERTPGVVAYIQGEGSSKSGELAEALSGGKKVVVCTIQTFPFALEAVRKLTATQGKRFAVIADEAHSSQTGEAANKLRAVLNAEELLELDDGGEVSTEDLLAAQMAGRADEQGITFVAFTATPKPKTLELFGTRPDPTSKPGPDNVPVPFHVYSMRQAIEEKFILDVLQNYTSFSLAFKLAHEGRELDDAEIERSAALRKIMSWVRLHPHNIAQKVQVVVEHFREEVAPLLADKAKAMIVVGSRLEAVRWKFALEQYIREKGYRIGCMVAFSGEVSDSESGPEPFTETTLNPGLKGRPIAKVFKEPEYRLLVAANKFQTGFDQPLLCGMYVDKRLAGIQAVQTLSRLNRSYPDKDTTFVLDFVNDPAEVLKAFKQYYTTAELASTTDPNLVFALRAKLDAAGHYDDAEVDRVVAVEFNPDAKQSQLSAAIEPVAKRLLDVYKSAQAEHKAAQASGDTNAANDAKAAMDVLRLFARDMATYVRLYTFLSQIFDYGNTAIEKRAIFYRRLIPLLEFGREREGVDLSQVRLTHHALRNRGQAVMQLDRGEKPLLYPITEIGSGVVQETQKAYLSAIIDKLNDLFAGDVTEQDKVIYATQVIMGKMLESDVLVQQAANNTKEQFANSPDLRPEVQNAIIEALDAHTSMSTQALNSEAVQAGIVDILLNHAGLWERLRERAAQQQRGG